MRIGTQHNEIISKFQGWVLIDRRYFYFSLISTLQRTRPMLDNVNTKELKSRFLRIIDRLSGNQLEIFLLLNFLITF